MLNGEDIVVLLALGGRNGPPTVRSLEQATTIPKSAVHRALGRLAQARLVDPQTWRLNLSAAEEFLLHGVRYVFPAQLGAERRGIPTAWAEQPLASKIKTSGDLPPVWPHAHGTVRGLAVEPIHRLAINAAGIDPEMRKRLSLLDGLRVGDARVRGVAGALLSERLEAQLP